jgi:integrase
LSQAAAIAARLDELAAGLASLREAALGSPLQAGESATAQRCIVGARGIRSRAQSYGVDTRIKGHKIRRGGFASRAEAERWLWEVRSDPIALEAYLLGQYTSPTVERTIGEYMKDRGGDVRSADRHEQYKAHLLPELGPLEAAAVRQRDVDRYLALRLRDGAAPKTAHNELCFLRTALRYAWRNDRLAQQPRFVLRAPHCERSRIASAEELRRLLVAAGEDLRRLVAGAAILGMRRGEMIAARWEWCHDRVLTLPADVTKTGRGRSVRIPEGLWVLLQAEPRHPERLWPRLRHGPNGRGRLEAVPWYPTTLRRAWEAACAAAGCADLHLHDLRRTFASSAQQRGHSLAAVRGAGGWEAGGALERHYSHASPELVAAVGADLEMMVLG